MVSLSLGFHPQTQKLEPPQETESTARLFIIRISFTDSVARIEPSTANSLTDQRIYLDMTGKRDNTRNAK